MIWRKAREGKGRERKARQGKGGEGKGREGKGREEKGREAGHDVRFHPDGGAELEPGRALGLVRPGAAGCRLILALALPSQRNMQPRCNRGQQQITLQQNDDGRRCKQTTTDHIATNDDRRRCNKRRRTTLHHTACGMSTVPRVRASSGKAVGAKRRRRVLVDRLVEVLAQVPHRRKHVRHHHRTLVGDLIRRQRVQRRACRERLRSQLSKLLEAEGPDGTALRADAPRSPVYDGFRT